MADLDLASLLYADEPTAREKSQALAAALRGQGTAGLVAQLTGDPVLSRVGESITRSAQHQQDQLAELPQSRAKLALEGEQLGKAKRENDAMADPHTATVLRNAYRAAGLQVDDDVPAAALTLPVMGHLAQAREAAQARKLQFGYLSDYREQGRQQQQEKMYQKMADDLGGDLDAMKGRGGPLAQVQQKILAAQRLSTLVHDDSGNIRDLPPQQVGEAAQSLAALLSGGSSPAHSEIERVVPKSLWGDVAGLQQFLTNRPTGAGQQAFLHLIADTSQREEGLARKTIGEAIAPRITKKVQLLRERPELARPILRAFLQPYGMGPDDFDFQTGLMAKPPAPAAPAPGPQGVRAPTIDPGMVQKYKASLQPGERLVVDPTGNAHALGQGEALPQGFTEVP